MSTESTPVTITALQVHNALHPPACAEIGVALDRFEDTEDAAVAVITGDGDKAFSAGFDLRWAEANPEVYRDPSVGSEITRRTRSANPDSRCNGIAFGLGFELALACDLIVAAPHATFGLPESPRRAGCYGREASSV